MQSPDDEKLENAICHSVNYHSLDSRLGISDHAIAKLLWPEVSKHLRGVTDIQLIEGMKREERERIRAENE